VRASSGLGGAARKVGFWAGSPLLPYAEPISAGCALSFPGRKLDSKTAWAKGSQASHHTRCLRFLVRVVFQSFLIAVLLHLAWSLEKVLRDGPRKMRRAVRRRGQGKKPAR
jgi:hypothetical protein